MSSIVIIMLLGIMGLIILWVGIETQEKLDKNKEKHEQLKKDLTYKDD
jgi:hypothetical protein